MDYRPQAKFNATVTYTLTANCTQTGELIVSDTPVTINGAGYIIQPSGGFADTALLTLGTGTTLNLNSRTIDGLSINIPTLITTAGGAFNADRVTFRGSYGSNLNVDGDATLTNVLFEGNVSQAFHSGGNASALNVSSFGGAVTVTNAVFRDNYDGGGAIVVNPAGSGSVTTNGCLTFSGNIPYNVFGTWTDNSTGACSGVIGNGGTAVIPPPERLPCGLPGAGHLDSSASYVLRSDCDLSGTGSTLWTISEGVNISIQGNGYRLSGGSGSNWRWIEQAGRGTLTLRNVVVDHIKTSSYGTLNIEQSTFRDTSERMLWIAGTATIRNSLFENIIATTRTARNASVLLVAPNYGSGHATITNSVFRNNSSGGAPVLNTWRGSVSASTITLNGCITFDSNSPVNTYGGNATDNSSGACGANVVVGPTRPVSDRPSSSVADSEDTGVRQQPDNCFEGLGSIGVICRPRVEPKIPIIEVWKINDDSTGAFILEAAQPEALHSGREGLIKSGLNGRVGIYIGGPECTRRNEHGDSPRIVNVDCVAN